MMPPTTTLNAVREFMQEQDRNRAGREGEPLALDGELTPPVEKHRFRFSRIVFWTKKTPLKPIESAS